MFVPERKVILKKAGLSRPSQTPALQAAHVANVNTRIAAVYNGPLIPIDLLGNTYISQGSVATDVTNSLPIIGPALTNSAISSGHKITGLTVETPTSITCAAIVYLIAGQGGANMPAVCTNSSSTSGTGGVFFGPSSGTVIMQSIGPNTFKQGLKLQNDNRPYFIAGCVDGSVSNFVATDLSTGLIQSSTGTGLTFAVNDGTYSVAATNVIHMNRNYMAAGMMSNADLTLVQLLAWARNPWGFWYPV